MFKDISEKQAIKMVLIDREKTQKLRDQIANAWQARSKEIRGIEACSTIDNLSKAIQIFDYLVNGESRLTLGDPKMARMKDLFEKERRKDGQG